MSTFIRKRGGNPERPANQSEIDDRPTALRKGYPLRPSRPTDSMILAESVARSNDHSDIAETVEAHLLPRKSLSAKLHLRILPQDLEVEARTIKRTQTTKQGDLVETSDPSYRVTWKSDKTLLSTQKVEQMPKDFKRVTSKSKRKIWQPELPATVEVSTETEIDGLNLLKSKP